MSERYSVILPAEGERLMAAVNQIDNLTDDIEGLQDSVAYLLMGDEQSFWPDD